ncbi:uncharacterized protein Z519_00331 [Cladophialophora bantiana CBS 173.52]|uniref:Uncharacterized protein n=1 Tax=Cladophialophora bantiana (strain ATCC 10958 / CBS 173.52 / CDC B-1940 / NIH 8579) TaxID=1442370 RepID=A0A0D2I5X7_CLAB1|nr:uncharacterized protein Z519_00331 [Cladophialophora bantiana CBS 173.52]KIW98670.1 hypothetical protein Z519_00331 [Cladophialophora bantiana CBS 173.52]
MSFPENAIFDLQKSHQRTREYGDTEPVSWNYPHHRYRARIVNSLSPALIPVWLTDGGGLPKPKLHRIPNRGIAHVFADKKTLNVEVLFSCRSADDLAFSSRNALWCGSNTSSYKHGDDLPIHFRVALITTHRPPFPQRALTLLKVLAWLSSSTTDLHGAMYKPSLNDVI